VIVESVYCFLWTDKYRITRHSDDEPEMAGMYYKVLMELGHMGAGKSHKLVRYFKADNLGALFKTLKQYLGLKSKGRAKGVLMVEPINRQAYEKGKVLEWKRDYVSRNFKDSDSWGMSY
jgi:hypothetical protein